MTQTNNTAVAVEVPVSETKRGPVEGVYRLVSDVKNPKPDKRAKNQWNAQAIIPKGLRLRSNGYGRLSKVNSNFEEVSNSVHINEETGLYGLLVANMKPEAEVFGGPVVGTVLTEARVDCIDASEALAMLVEMGKVSVEDVKAAVEMVTVLQGPEDNAPDFKAFQTKHGLV